MAACLGCIVSLDGKQEAVRARQSSRGQTFGVTGEHGGLAYVMQAEVQHGHSLQTYETVDQHHAQVL